MPITKRTVLVLGAGASKEYGLPLGEQLRNLVLNCCTPGGSSRRLLLDAGFADQEIDAFYTNLRYSAFRSVDAFLERNPSFIDIGKAAIATTLLPLENEDKLFPPHGPSDDWYNVLANKMDVGFSDIRENQLSVVTFNYDRTLEHYLSKAIAQRKGIDRDDAHNELCAAIPIVHVHGSLGAYPAGVVDGLEFGQSPSATTVRIAAQRIKIVGQVAKPAPVFADAQHLLTSSDRVYFLGFGFHPDSVRRLGLFDPSTALDKRPLVGGTRQQITPGAWSDIEGPLLKGYWHSDMSGGSAYTFIRDVAHLD